MTNKIGIGIDANIDTSKVIAGINKIGQEAAKVNRVQVAPVTDKAVTNATKLFETLKKIHPEINRRAKATGQADVSFEDFDFKKAGYSNHKIRQIQQYVGATSGANAGGGGSGGSGFGGIAAGAAQAGLRAAGPVGSVASGALSSGMAGGAGAGLMGLMGGMLALGVGKLVSGVMDKIDQAENNAVAYDQLKRVLGDVSVSFGSLKAVVQAGANNLSVTFDEATRLSSQFAKLSNMKGGQFGSLGDELKVGVGLSRSYGLDPSFGVGVMGQLRGVGATKDVQDSRRFALLIGETIGRSGAFAKADEVMEALASYTTSQTRSGLGGANTSGYAGLFSALVGSGIPGLDPSGAAAMMGRINSSLAAGGAKGEASQFFTGMVGSRMGLNPIQTQIMREGGAFATNDNSFGSGSVYSRYMGGNGPGGSGTFLDSSLSMLRQQYGGNKGMLAQATANHLGIGIRQAMGLLSIDPNQMGEMQGYAGDLTKLSGSGIGNLGKALYGSAADRQSLAGSYLTRSGSDAINAADRSAITGAMGNDGKLREVLAKMAGQYDQERTQGSDIRDSKNRLDNINTSIADKLVPLTQEIRHGIIYMAGDGKKSAVDIQAEVLGLDSRDRMARIGAEYDVKRKGAIDEVDAIKKQREAVLDNLMKNRDRMSPADVDAAQNKIMRLAEEEALKGEEVRLRILDLQKEKEKALADEVELLKRNVDDLRKGVVRGENGEIVSGPGAPAGGGGGGSASPLAQAGAGDTAEAMKFFMGKGWTKNQAAGIVANFTAESGLNHGAIGDGGAAYGVGQWHPDRQAAFKRWAGKDIRDSTRLEQYEFANYELTQGAEMAAGNKLRGASQAGDSGAVVSRHYERPKYAELEAAKRALLAERIAAGTPSPGPISGGDGGWGREVRFSADPIIVEHRNQRGETIMPSQSINTRVDAPAFGAHGAR